MSLADTSEPVVIVRESDGTIVKLQRCTPDDKISLRWVFRTWRGALMKHLIESWGLSVKDAVPYLHEIVSRPLYDSDVDRWLLEPEGQREAILLSLQSGKSDEERKQIGFADVNALGLSDGERLTAAIGVMNLKLSSKKDAGASPFPETGDAKPPPSPGISDST